MSVQIRRADFADYWSYLDAVAAPVGGCDSHVVWDEDEEEWVLEREDDDSTDGVSVIP
jgi:hypothetical protein